MGGEAGGEVCAEFVVMKTSDGGGVLLTLPECIVAIATMPIKRRV
jgi:hypothetical protein